MKKILMVAFLSFLTVGVFATDKTKNKKQHKCENCTQKKCTPACKDKTGCAQKSCSKKA